MKKPWRKVLYEKQDYPDNYCGPEFLRELQKNVTVETYTFSESIQGSCVLMQQISSVLIYVIIFSLVYSNTVATSTVLTVSTVLACCSYFIFLCLDKTKKDLKLEIVTRNSRTVALYIGFAYGLSPIFKSLTETISTDTIYALSTMMFLTNVIFADYGVDVFVVSYALSLNAGIFGAVCLISRLSTTNDVFTVLTLAVQIFALWPLFRHKLIEKYSKLSAWITFILALITVGGFICLPSFVSLCLYILGHFIITFVCPYWLVSMQNIKNTIHGPWDEAVIDN